MESLPLSLLGIFLMSYKPVDQDSNHPEDEAGKHTGEKSICAMLHPLPAPFPSLDLQLHPHNQVSSPACFSVTAE